MIPSGVSRMARLLRKGWRVGAFRSWQEVKLGWLAVTGGWPRIAASVSQVAERESARWLEATRGGSGLIPADGRAAFLAWAREHPAWVAKLEARVSSMAAGRFEVFDQPVAISLDAVPWGEDWRFGHRWEPRYFRAYDFYDEGKSASYDVKRPWELSRMGWLVTLLESATLKSSAAPGELASTLLLDWEAKNPVGWSVDWMPMEASIRGVHLALSAGMLAADPGARPGDVTPWLRLGILHGEFVSRVVEWTDVNNNHYVSNLAALALLGRLLAPVYRPAVGWYRFGEARLWREILTEFHPDGVNYEMATGYHRLVTELGLLAALSADRAGEGPPPGVGERLGAAVRYVAAYMRPDGWAPAVGDNDSSRVLDFDNRHTRDHGELLALGAAYTGVSLTGNAPESAAVPWLMGPGLHPAGLVPNEGALHPFPGGGIFIARAGGNYLFTDLGEVGLRGRGGHGHNDTLGFELHLAGEAVFVDPGTPCYTGDLARHREARSTASHNVLRVDGQELAPLTGPWGIANEAVVRNPTASESGGQVTIAGEHQGYGRLQDPVLHRRTWRFLTAKGRLSLTDRIESGGPHRIERFLHLAPAARIEVGTGQAVLRLPGGASVRCRWGPETTARLMPGWVADSYGSERPAEVLVLEAATEGTAELEVLVELDPPVS